MSSVSDNNMGPVHDCTPQIDEIVSQPHIKHAAIHSLHQKHHESTVHHFHDAHLHEHIANWKVLKYAEEIVEYGTNYFIKVNIGGDLCIHIRVHRQRHAPIYDFYSIHETIKHNEASCIWSNSEPLVYFNY
ncbi:hypothetical protein NAEGRDRAFT_80480 [Naegleria gruberi]|uniref:Cystatin domain-containing protein n=1 Tax=Naegleria gruberi TaxID=5762 RepID=D2VLW3_NAEGR|nr:uncharacterized protein NAEGRDRAFT_80480 [Naegleria gruberi]EFC42212.1 hypothetical protein NAEGRDRAFT_80480 [Naegleria gruberi]|eukprot:XP_002674956.1 hypothetical protein NAEGRDRAFT_80480 [Naegleria gruberi strain NEG-M]